MQLSLELLAPARNTDIGISAIDCGADAVYIAGPAFGAREAAANPISEIERLSRYAHRFGARVYMTLNTILYDNELAQAEQYIKEAYSAGCDAIIIQDLGILRMDLPPIDLYASTQCNIRTPEQARWLESLGFKRLILARELSLEQIRNIRAATSCELESFIHGALCVSYSGQCYLSQALAGRSANRGCCIQACRSKYDLVDASGKEILKDKTILSLKDLSLKDYIGSLVDAGITSFKIEGRLKNASYVKNVTRYYRQAIDECRKGVKSSFGTVTGGFRPNLEYTFSRSYTPLFIEGERGSWNSRESSKSLGEYLGTISKIAFTSRQGCTFDIAPAGKASAVANGDGLCIITPKGESIGLRADIAQGLRITVKNHSALCPGCSVYRNLNQRFEKELENNMPRRLIHVGVSIKSSPETISFEATAENSQKALYTLTGPFEEAKNPSLAMENLRSQIGKITDIYLFSLEESDSGFIPFLPLSQINSVRRALAEELAKAQYTRSESIAAGQREIIPPAQQVKLNCGNRLSREVYLQAGINPPAAFELATASSPAAEEYSELMRTKYCIKYELGLCPKQKSLSKRLEFEDPLYLINNGRRLPLLFDCKRCEMVIIS